MQEPAAERVMKVVDSATIGDGDGARRDQSACAVDLRWLAAIGLPAPALVWYG